MTVYVLAGRPTATNLALIDAVRDAGAGAELLLPSEADRVRPTDTVIGRLDVLPGLDGIEPGLQELRELDHRGVRVLNRADALWAAHDKLETARRLGALGVAHPWTELAEAGRPVPAIDGPCVVKPRFGSWGAEVYRCEGREELDELLAALADEPWYRAHGALVQELVPPMGHDVRVLVAADEVVGAIERVCPPGEWRTNVGLGAERRPCEPTPEAAAVAVWAASAIEADLVGVDLLPGRHGEPVVIELNGAVDFTLDYSLGGRDVFAAVTDALLPFLRRREPPLAVF